MTETPVRTNAPDAGMPEAYVSAVPMPDVCPDCGARNVRWRFEGARSLTDPPFLIRGAWTHRDGMKVHAVVWTPEQVAAVRNAEARSDRT